ncbi:hypothetical protein AZ34_16480 [Hylemonella gracilis str. Niagara R]|uniref:DUF4089 domain-containing protein n=1 Tax=Hylemonella gracilis str. Niagara R TaxID=1458275 RepID=A0A016XKS8_9BURK|nr:DUF4089 domain-containing protein [Hylemonella gracilis]EYC52495.1 hypothetical protein AZ34_16480 [Hylemonella gracilis str. Niagara R]
MSDDDMLTYVRASARLLALPLDEARVARVAGHLQRTAALAALLERVDLSVEDEPAELYCPARPVPGAST